MTISDLKSFKKALGYSIYFDRTALQRVQLRSEIIRIALISNRIVTFCTVP